MLELVIAFLLGLGIGLVLLELYIRRHAKKYDQIFDEKRYGQIQKDIDKTLKKLRNIG